MNILSLCSTDWAGCGIRLTDAINRNSKHKARQVALSPHRFGYHYDIITREPGVIKKWVDWADVVNCWSDIRALKTCKTIPKKLIWTFTGTPFRKNPTALKHNATQLNAKILVSTPDLLFFKDLIWLPNAVPVDEWFKMKTTHSGKPIVCQSPSSKPKKNTAKILKYISNKKNIDPLIIHKVKWKQCIKLKSKADIYIGPFKIGYGVSQLEAMAMKIPVITKLEPENEAKIRRAVGYLPHYDCPMEKLSEGIDTLLSDRELYDEYAELGHNYVKEFHDYPVVAKKFILICEKLINKK